MATIDFPASPVVNDEFVVAGTTYVWNGYGWIIKPAEGTGDLTDFYTKAESDARFLNLNGGTVRYLNVYDVTGNARLDLAKTGPNSVSFVVGRKDTFLRWTIVLGNDVTETGGNIGSNLDIGRYDDTGGYIGIPLSIDRATGAVSIPAAPTLGQHVANKTYVDTLVVGKLDVSAADLRYVKVEMFEDLIKTLMARIEALEAR